MSKEIVLQKKLHRATRLMHRGRHTNLLIAIIWSLSAEITELALIKY
ncbi:hypothetical protein KC887_02775 [Candidatus Kaiserbacteria bacterium]|nr:hypothetical protein [Candidatus Kaiserbacteria bacterium]